MNSPTVLAELKRLNVYKVAVEYVVVVSLLIQTASIFLSAFNARQWAMQIVILILGVGFPIALVFMGLPVTSATSGQLFFSELERRNTNRMVALCQVGA
jgi:hypothetical protein